MKSRWIEQQCPTSVALVAMGTGLAVQPSEVAQSHQNLVDDSACPLGAPWPAQRLQVPHHEAHVLTHPPCSVDSDARPASSADDNRRDPVTTPGRLHNVRATSAGFSATVATSSRNPSDLQRSGERQLSKQQDTRTGRGWCGKRKNVRENRVAQVDTQKQKTEEEI